MTFTPAQVAALRARFAVRAARDIVRLQDAKQAGDLAAVRHVAHQLIGAGGSFGMPRVTSAAQQLEQALDSAGLTGADSALAQLIQALGDAAAA